MNQNLVDLIQDKSPKYNMNRKRKYLHKGSVYFKHECVENMLFRFQIQFHYPYFTKRKLRLKDPSFIFKTGNAFKNECCISVFITIHFVE